MKSDLQVLDRFRQVFDRDPKVTAAASGRIEFIGNHTDYNGGEVLGAAIDKGIRIAVAPRADRRVRFHSSVGGNIIESSLDTLVPLKGTDAWINYPCGVLKVLLDLGMPAPHGFDCAVVSDLPAGAGLSSSAAFELSTATALCALYGFEMTMKERVLACQKAENTFVGVPCGMLDQAVSGFGRKDHLVHIDCARVEFKPVPMPGGLHFWIFNTNLKHSLIDSMYERRHGECRAALEQLRAAGVEAGHLASVPVEVLRAHEGALDAVNFQRARHVIEEHARVRACVELLGAGRLHEAGELLYASHWSSSKLFENSIPELDTLVEIAAAHPAIIGARLTGGGFGGAVMALTKGDFDSAAAKQVAAAYCERRPEAPKPTIFHVATGEGARLL